MANTYTPQRIAQHLLGYSTTDPIIREACRLITGRMTDVPPSAAQPSMAPIMDGHADAAKAEDAMRRAEANADPDWLAAAQAQLEGFILCGAPFTATDVLAALDSDGYATHDRRALGPLIRKASHDKQIAPTGRMVNSGRHGRPQREWRRT